MFSQHNFLRFIVQKNGCKFFKCRVLNMWCFILLLIYESCFWLLKMIVPERNLLWLKEKKPLKCHYLRRLVSSAEISSCNVWTPRWRWVSSWNSCCSIDLNTPLSCSSLWKALTVILKCFKSFLVNP